MVVIVAVVVLWTVLVLGMLVGVSVHREATRRQRRRVEADQRQIARDREVLEEERRLLRH